jgi:hypothetical protein
LKKGPLNLQVSCLSTTTDGEFIDYRKLRLERLVASKGPKEFEIAVALIKPSQKILVIAACEELAGTEVHETYVCSIPAEK